MSGTALDHALVRDYLRELDAALAPLPAGRAAELREQITAHLEDALRPEADDGEVTIALRRLGQPGDLAAEAARLFGLNAAVAAAAAAAVPPAPAVPAARTPQPIARSRARLSRRSRAVLAAGVLTAAVAAVLVALSATSVPVAPLRFAGSWAWWYPKDRARDVDTNAGDADQSTVPVRSGQLQGFVIEVDNPSRSVQTVLGVAPGWVSPGGPDAQAEVSTSHLGPDAGFLPTSYAYAAPETIPARQSRDIRVLWRSITCLQGPSEQGTNQLPLRVRVDSVTRTETITLPAWFTLKGPTTGRYFISGTRHGSQCP